MANTTNVHFKGFWDYDNKTRIFGIKDKNSNLFLEEFDNGIVKIDVLAGTFFDDFAEIACGCFNEDSNFAAEVLKAYECDENTTFIGIKFEFNGVTLTVTKENADKDKLCKEFEEGMEANAEKSRLEREAWLKTPEGQEYLKQQKKEAARKKAIEKEVINIDETTEMEFKDDEAKKEWDNFVEINSKDPYSNGVIVYARRWAKYMQKLISEGKNLIEIAGKASHDCDIDGITGFMYGCAVSTLAQTWKYGEELRKWHNKEYGQENSNGVVNPAILTVSVD